MFYCYPTPTLHSKQGWGAYLHRLTINYRQARRRPRRATEVYKMVPRNFHRIRHCTHMSGRNQGQVLELIGDPDVIPGLGYCTCQRAMLVKDHHARLLHLLVHME